MRGNEFILEIFMEFYQHLVYVLPTKKVNFSDFIVQLQSYYQDKIGSEIKFIQPKPNKLVLDFNDTYSFYLTWNDDEFVIEEAQEIVDENFFENDFSDTLISIEKKNLLRQATQRIEFSGDGDLDMNYFNEMLFIFGELEKVSDIVILNIG